MPFRSFSWSRVAAWAVAIAVHVALVLVVLRPEEAAPDRGDTVDAPLEPAFVDWVPVMPPSEPAAALMTRPAEGRRRSSRRTAPSTPTTRRMDPARAVASPIGMEVRPLVEDVLYDDAGRPRLPDEPLYAGTKAPPDHYRMPGDGSEDEVFYRPPVLEPQEDRIVFRWEPSRTLAGAWYDRLVKATSARTAIPLGPKFSLVCGASLAGLGGSCHIERNGGTGVIVHRSADPPPWEKARSVQCRGLRDDLAEASDPERVVWLLDRLVALCSGEPAPSTLETTTPGTGPGVGTRDGAGNQSDLAGS